MTEKNDEKPTLATPLQRMGAALALVPDVGSAAAAAWPDWLAALLPEAALIRPGRLILGISLSGDGRRVTAQAINNADQVAPRLHEHLAGHDVPEAELDRIRLLGGRFHPPQIGVWHAWESEREDAGWFFPVAFPFNVALAESPPQPAVAALRVWAESERIRISAGFGRAVLGPTRHSALQIILPGPDVDIQLGAAQKALAAVDLPPLPSPVIDNVIQLARGTLRLSLWLTDHGVIKAGLLVPRPAPALVAALKEVAPPTAPLTAFADTLQRPGVAVLECQQSRDGLGLTFHYNVPTHGE